MLILIFGSAEYVQQLVDTGLVVVHDTVADQFVHVTEVLVTNVTLEGELVIVRFPGIKMDARLCFYL